MKKKDIEITVRDTKEGVELLVGKKLIGAINETEEVFQALMNEKELSVYKTYADAEEAIVRQYNLNH